MSLARSTHEQYSRAVEAFRAAPANFSAASRAAGLHRSTVKRLWEEGCVGGVGWGEPISQLIEYEQLAARARLQQEQLKRDAAEAQATVQRVQHQAEVEQAAAVLEEERAAITARMEAQVQKDVAGKVRELAASDATSQVDAEAKAVRALQSNGTLALAISGVALRGGLTLVRQIEQQLAELAEPVIIPSTDGRGKKRSQELVEHLKQKAQAARVRMSIQLTHTISRLSKDSAEVIRMGLVLERLRLGTPAELASPLAAYDRMSDEELMQASKRSYDAFTSARARMQVQAPAPVVMDDTESAVEGVLPEDGKERPAPDPDEPEDGELDDAEQEELDALTPDVATGPTAEEKRAARIAEDFNVEEGG